MILLYKRDVNELLAICAQKVSYVNAQLSHLRIAFRWKKKIIPDTILGAKGIYRCATQGSYP